MALTRVRRSAHATCVSGYARGMGRSACAATLALVALLALACGTPDAPAPTPASPATATPVVTPTVVATAVPEPTPTPTVEPTPTATPTPEPTPAPLAELVEPAPDAFEHRTFEPGERIYWGDKIEELLDISFFMDTNTGRIEGYNGGAISPDGNWLQRWGLLLDRQSGNVWRLLQSRIIATDKNRLLLSRSGSYVLTDREFREVATFSVPPLHSAPPHVPYGGEMAFFSPDSHKIALRSGADLYLVDIEKEDAMVLMEVPEDEEWGWPDFVSMTPVRMGQEILVTIRYHQPGEWDYRSRDHRWSGYRWQRYRFNWEGDSLPWAQQWIDLSPDGEYVAWEEGGVLVESKGSFGTWPNFVFVADVSTGKIIFRVRSATLTYGDRLRGSRWLASGDGLVMEVRDGFVIARVRPTCEIISLPAAPPEWYGASRPVPLPAPVGTDRFFSYGRLGLYDARDDRWVIVRLSEVYGIVKALPSHYDPWISTDNEMRFMLGHMDHDERYSLFAGYPRIEFPPFNGKAVLRVARTRSCLYLRNEPSRQGGIRDCLPDGARLVPIRSGAWEEREYPLGGGDGPSIGWSDGHWVYVRTDDGAEGWVAHEYLDWY